MEENLVPTLAITVVIKTTTTTTMITLIIIIPSSTTTIIQIMELSLVLEMILGCHFVNGKDIVHCIMNLVNNHQHLNNIK